MHTRLSLTTGTLALAVLVLTGCAAPDGAAPDDPAGPGTEGGTSSTALADCLIGSWALDAADLADQLRDTLSEDGLPIIAAQAAGEVTLDVDAGRMTYTSAVTYALTAAPSGGPEMVMTQAQDGVSHGDWTTDGSILRFTSWENGLTFTTTATIAGQSVDLPLDLPADSFGGTTATVECDATTMTTVSEGGLFFNTWGRID